MSKPETTAFQNGAIAAMKLLHPTDAEIRLACGELTAQEMRTAHAILGWARTTIQQAVEKEYHDR